MRPILLSCLVSGCALFVASPLNGAPAQTWSYGFGGPGMNTAYDVAVDNSGNVVVAGAFTGTMNLGGAPLVSAGVYDIFLAKFDATGAPQWSKRFGGAGTDGARRVAIDAAGNITITGSCQGNVSLGGAALTGRGGDDIFVARYDAAGNHLWSRGFGTARDDEGKDVAVDASGNVIVTGHYGAAIDFGGGPTPFVGSVDCFVLKLDANGVYQWSKVAGSANIDEGLGVAVDASNNVVVTGSFFSTVNFGGGNLVSAGLSDAFVVKYAANGSHLWSTRLGVSGISDVGEDVGVDASGGVIVTGADKGAFLARYDASGVKQWTRNFTSSSSMQSLGLDLSPAGTIAITGNLQGTTNFGGGPLASAGADDIFLALFDATGVHRWSQRFGNTGGDLGYACAFDPSGALIATGEFSSTVNFGGAPLVSLGNTDIYLVKFDDHVADTTPPVITCPGNIAVEQVAPAGTPATDPAIAAFLAAATATDDTDPAPVIINDAPDMFPPGTTPVTFLAKDASGNRAECTANVSVVDTAPPVITVVLDKTVLWPPNHKFVPVCAKVTVSDNGSAPPSWSLVSITSNEDADGHGDGHTAEDFRDASFGTPDACVDLRAERAGNGDGRVYEIIYAAKDASGNVANATVHVRVPHDMSDEGESGLAALTSVHPNPFNPETTVEYSLLSSSRVRVDIFDARGALVRRLVDESMPAGNHRVVWTGLDDAGRPVSSGIYFVKMNAGGAAETRKIVLLK
jgi:hypothetical protein